MKLGKILLKVGQKLTGNSTDESEDNNTEEEIQEDASSSGDGSWGCWWIFNKPRTPKIFK